MMGSATGDEARVDGYALAGALSVTTSELLRRVHVAAGPPSVADVASASQHRRATAVAAAQALSAAAACSALVTRLLIAERDAARRQLSELGRPQITETGVTILEGL